MPWPTLLLAPLLAAAFAAPTDESAAVEALRARGATVLKVSQKDDLYEVDFHLEGRAAGDDALIPVAELRKVARLNLANTQVTDAGLAHLAGLQDLTHLYLQNTAIQGSGLAHVAALPRLEYVNLYGTAVDDAGLRHLAGCAALKQVFLWQTKVTPDGALALLAAHPDLYVDLGADAPPLLARRVYSEEKTAAALARIAAAGGAVYQVAQDSDEVEIDFHLGGEASDEVLAALAEIPGLIGLHLGGTAVTDAGLEHVGALADLRKLHLEHTAVGDAGVARLTKLHQLVYLNLFDTRVTDAAVESLGKLRALRSVYLWQTGVTEAGAEALRAANPALHVDMGWVATLAAAEPAPELDLQEGEEEAPGKDLTCCERATAAGKECEHPCCVAAREAGRTCFPCNPKLAKTCCEKAEAEGAECGHPCCVEARAAGKLCEKCNPAKS